MSLNKVMLIGNVGKDPEIKGTTEKKVARLSIATTDKYTDRNGEPHENTEWHSVVAFNKTADVIERFVHKGDKLYVEGKLHTNEWTAESGEKRRTTEINAERIELLGGGSSQQNDTEVARLSNGRSNHRYNDNEF